MLCLKCKTEMVIRDRKFGRFMACPKSNPSDNHGTFSLNHQAVYYDSRVHAAVTASARSTLDTLIQQEMMALGGRRMRDLDLFAEGNSEFAEDNDDHWSNMRPY